MDFSSNTTAFYISLALMALLCLGCYLFDHNHKEAGKKLIVPILLFMIGAVALCSVGFIFMFIYYLFIK